jgi:uncharacterized protein
VTPGVYVEESPGGPPSITGVPSGVTAFIGRALRGPVNQVVPVRTQSEFDRIFGGLWNESTMSYDVQLFFLNGGTDALIVRVQSGGGRADVSLPAGTKCLLLDAANVGAWGNGLRCLVDYAGTDPTDGTVFNLTVQATDTESFPDLSIDPTSPRFVSTVLEQRSNLVRVHGAVPAERPDPGISSANGGGSDGAPITDADISGDGLAALETADFFNLLVIPPLDRTREADPSATLAPALALVKQRRAMLLVDAPGTWTTAGAAASAVNTLPLHDPNAALYFPRLRMPDPANGGRLDDFPPCGAVAGIYARTATQRGVWKAPAGTEATIAGISGLSLSLSDADMDRLNPLGVNCLRTIPGDGSVVWGSRTLAGAGSEHKYVPVRRLALFLEESIFRGTQWAIFEPNAEPLWARLRLSVGAFLQDLFTKGAFQGRTPRDAYFIKCDRETTTQDDINLGILNIVVGFAPLRPAVFVDLHIGVKASRD